MTLQDLRTLLDFHYWARDRILAAVRGLTAEQFTRDMGSSFPSVRDTLVHLYSAEWAWCERWHGNSPTAHRPPDQFKDVESIASEWSTLEGRVRAFLDALDEDGVARVFTYRLFSGQEGSSPFWQMLQHVVNHGTYHRGQVTTMLRQLGASPAKSVEVIAFYRERSR